MKITLSEPNGPYKAEIDTEVMEVTLRDVFLGVAFETEDGCRLSVCMRDDGYEVRLDDGPWVEFKPTVGAVKEDRTHRCAFHSDDQRCVICGAAKEDR